MSHAALAAVPPLSARLLSSSHHSLRGSARSTCIALAVVHEPLLLPSHADILASLIVHPDIDIRRHPLANPA